MSNTARINTLQGYKICPHASLKHTARAAAPRPTCWLYTHRNGRQKTPRLGSVPACIATQLATPLPRSAACRASSWVNKISAASWTRLDLEQKYQSGINQHTNETTALLAPAHNVAVPMDCMHERKPRAVDQTAQDKFMRFTASPPHCNIKNNESNNNS